MKQITLRWICFVLLVTQLPALNLAQPLRDSTAKQQLVTGLEQNGIRGPEQISVITETAGEVRRRQSREPAAFDDEFSASTGYDADDEEEREQARQDYLATLQGTTSDGQTETIGEYYFRVERDPN